MGLTYSQTTPYYHRQSRGATAAHAADEHGHGRHELDHSALLTLAADAIAAAKESEAATRVLDELNANDILPAIGKARVLQLCRPSAAQRTSRVAAIRVFDV